ncbi:mavicyanin-like [Dorcoceras hygrometricum]|uniref:Mavicyanin-like n=1 Tax=Dorcoceras hygrometricum TaxID=472368 RepID=A0A2Z7A697_9LAMI|nr:mavicyanin-like [Dorcoceras hygrometricum]
MNNQMFTFFMMSFLGFSVAGTVYNVGDSSGWTIIGNVDYNQWASSKIFQVDDTLLFSYDPQYHNVLEVSRSDFHSCDATAPISAYSTGNDSIQIRSSGHYFYICGFVGHCQAGQKVDIRVPLSIQPTETLASGPAPAPIGWQMPTGPFINSGKSLVPDSFVLLLISFGFTLIDVYCKKSRIGFAF